ncbi:MAG: acyl carrier protein [Beijerinckiaceae bacterium]
MNDVRNMIAEFLQRQPADLADNAALGDTPGWDSFVQLNIMMELERRYGVDITDETIRAYSSLAAIDGLVKERR